MLACFIGHKNIERNEELISSLEKIVVTLIEKGVTTFLFGSKSEFDDLSWEVVTKLKEKYIHIKRIYVRAIYPYIDKSYEEYLLKYYEETYFPAQLENAGKYAYIERNYEMINLSTYCIFYYNENYIPPIEESTKNNLLPPPKRHSGTKIAYNYAIKKKKQIINLYIHN